MNEELKEIQNYFSKNGIHIDNVKFLELVLKLCNDWRNLGGVILKDEK